MNSIVMLLWLAGGMQLALVAVSFLLPEKLHYEENLSKVSPIIRQIFFMQHNLILFFLLGLSGLCLFFAPEIAEGGALGTYLSAGMALFWLLRLGAQTFFLDTDVKKQHRLGDLVYKGVFIVLCGIFTFATLQGVLS
jgi:hypothetical protein